MKSPRLRVHRIGSRGAAENAEHDNLGNQSIGHKEAQKRPLRCKFTWAYRPVGYISAALLNSCAFL